MIVADRDEIEPGKFACSQRRGNEALGTKGQWPRIAAEIGVGENEFAPQAQGKTCVAQPGDVIVQVDPRYFRPAEVETLLGDPTKAHEKLGWKPEITLQEMVSEMVAKDLEAAKKHSLLKSHGYEVAIALES